MPITDPPPEHTTIAAEVPQIREQVETATGRSRDPRSRGVLIPQRGALQAAPPEVIGSWRPDPRNEPSRHRQLPDPVTLASAMLARTPPGYRVRLRPTLRAATNSTPTTSSAAGRCPQPSCRLRAEDLQVGPAAVLPSRLKPVGFASRRSGAWALRPSRYSSRV
jgi:hypothetical protein